MVEKSENEGKKEIIDIDVIKNYAKKYKKKVDDFLALTKPNDPFYIQDNSRQKAEWFAEVWNKEKAISLNWEEGKIHPRGLHYQILGKYKLIIGKESMDYENTDQCWNFVEKGAKYARLLGLVPYESIKDEQNPEPINVPIYNEHKGFEIFDMDFSNDIMDLNLPYFIYEDTQALIEATINKIIKELFKEVKYYSNSDQPNYFEIWAEKKGVIPMDVAREFNATVKPAGGGEFSLDMCFQAVKKALDSNKDLHVLVLCDFDPKGRDMPKSVARKIEYVAKQFDVNAFVHYVALTKEQCIEYSLPTVPAKKPKRTDTVGAKAYISHSKMFKENAGRDPTELNSFYARNSNEYRDTLRNVMNPLFDKELPNKFRVEIGSVKQSIRELLTGKFDEIKEDLDKIRIEINEKFEELNAILQPIIDEKYEELELDKLIEKYEGLLNFDVSRIIDGVKFEIPNAVVKEADNPLLDTRRSYLEQIKAYKEFDIRTK